MRLVDWALTGLGAMMAVGSTARRGFEHLSRKGRAVRPGDGSVAGVVDRVVTRDVPSTVGHALGIAADGLVRSVELARQTAAAVPVQLDSAVSSLVRGAGIPSAKEIRELRQRLDDVAVRIDTLVGRSEAAATASPGRKTPRRR